MKARLRFLLYSIFFLSLSSNTTSEHSTSSAGDLRQHFLNSNFAACPKTLPYAAPRREPETILLDEDEEGEDAGKIREEGLPKPIQVGNCLFKCQLPTINAIHSFPDDADTKRMLKRHLANSDLDYSPDVYTEADYTAATKLPATNK